MKSLITHISTLVVLAALCGCRGNDIVYLPEPEPTVTPDSPPAEILGFYLLNEGNMGTNKASLDWYDAASGIYTRNIYSAANPDVPKELGDVGNDLKIYGSRLYAVINCSNKVEVMDSHSCRRIGTVEIPNCRSIAFDGPFAYITSYAGPVEISPEYRQRGYVAKVDTATLQITATCTVGFQPDHLAIAASHIYVANSGGYMVPNYERTMSVISLDEFCVVDQVDIDINLDCCLADADGHIWVSSRGDYYDHPSRLYCYDLASASVIADFDIPVSALWLHNHSLYTVSAAWSNITMQNEKVFKVIDTASLAVISQEFIPAEAAADIKVPYGVAVHPDGSCIYVTDGGNYVNPGHLYCFSAQGELLWKVRTGDIPAHFAFLSK